MDRTLKVIMTRDRHDKPLMQLCNLPGADAEVYPDQLRNLADACLRAADDCEDALRLQNGARPMLREFDLLPLVNAAGTMPMATVIYLCGTCSMGKTWLAKSLEKQAIDHGRKVLVIDSDGHEIHGAEIIAACRSLASDIDEVIVCWGPGQEENFPVKPFRVVRISAD